MNNKDLNYVLVRKIGIDDAFKFKCKQCGQCCHHREDILL